MNNIIDYLDWRCDVPLSVDPFNEVDNLILSELAYIDLSDIVPADGSPVPLENVCARYFESHTHEEVLSGKSFSGKAPLLMEKMLSGARFRSTSLWRYLDETDSEKEIQLAAVTFLLPDKSAYIAFRGTDGTLVGWKEDFYFSFSPATEGQKRAVDYLEEIAGAYGGVLRAGGHSKGGNLAVYAASTCDIDVQDRMAAVYSNDGPGFKEDIIASEGYRRMLPKIVSIVPDMSIIGLLLTSLTEHRVVRSGNSGIMQHDGFSWSVVRNRFESAALSDISLLVERSLSDWLSQMDDAERRSLTEIVFSLFESTGAESFSEMGRQKWKSAESILSALKNMPKEKQQEGLSFLRQLGSSGGQAITEFISSKILKTD